MGTILVPGSGLAAVRAIQAIRDSGRRSVAVFADDLDALHVSLADEAVSRDREGAADEVFPGPDLPQPHVSADADQRVRRISVWFMRDAEGSTTVVGSTDGSVRRRGEAIVVESPAPFLSDGVRTQMEEAAVEHADGVGVAVLETEISGDSVTVLGPAVMPTVGCAAVEQVTGLDLYREQLRIASGGPVPDTVVSRGHAVEFAVHAEDAALGFLAEPGVLRGMTVPGGPGVRIDVAAHRSSTRPTLIRGDGDSLLATVTARGTDRAHALTVARRALGEFAADGVATLVPFHQRLVDEPAFADPSSFSVHGSWVERDCACEPEPAEPATHPEELWGDDFAGLVRFTVDIDGEPVDVAASPVTLALLGVERADPAGDAD